MKLCVIGGGGVRSMFLGKSIAQRAKALGIQELVFMDIDRKKLDVFGGMARHVVGQLCPELEFRLTDDAVDALTGADYVITTIRVGGDDMRVRDERIALSRGVLGQETTGAAGFSFAMRSVPALARYCALARKHGKPGVKVFNFTNPAGVVSQALRDMGYDFTYGICDAPSNLLRQFADLYGVAPDRVEGLCYGLNHLSYFPEILVDGRNVVPELIEREDTYTRTDMRFFQQDLVRHQGCILNEYLYYYYYREQAVENLLHAEMTRGESIADINRRMLAELSSMDVERDFPSCLAVFEKWYGRRENSYMASETGVQRDKPWQFDLYDGDEGGYAGVALKFIEIERSGRQGGMILCVPNNGAIADLRDSDTVEITCDIDASGCRPRPVGEVEETHLELIRRVKSYERLAARAVVERDKRAAVDCLTLHPLVNSYSLAKDLTEAYCRLNGEYSPDWR